MSDEVKNISKLEIRNNESRRKLNAVFEEYLNNGKIKELSVRKLCAPAGLSTSTFYNLYKSFSKFKVAYLINDFCNYFEIESAQDTEFEELDNVQKIIAFYGRYTRYCEMKGYEFMSVFYQPDNTELSIFSFEINGFDRIVAAYKTMYGYIQEDQKKGKINSSYDPRKILYMLYFSVTEIIFTWCLTQGGFNLTAYICDYGTAFFLPDLLDLNYKLAMKRLDYMREK